MHPSPRATSRRPRRAALLAALCLLAACHDAPLAGPSDDTGIIVLAATWSGPVHPMVSGTATAGKKRPRVVMARWPSDADGPAAVRVLPPIELLY